MLAFDSPFDDRLFTEGSWLKHLTLILRATACNMSSIQQRKEEILAKKAKLAELKKQRELRQKEFTSNRQSLDAGEVNNNDVCRRLETD